MPSGRIRIVTNESSVTGEFDWNSNDEEIILEGTINKRQNISEIS